MKTVTEIDFLENYKKYEAEAQVDPITIICDEDIHLVLISATEFAEFEKFREQKPNIPPQNNP